MNKKAISTIIATLLIIVLTVLACGVIWIVVRSVIVGEITQFNITKNFCDDYEKICDKHCMNFCLDVSSDAIEKNDTFTNSLYERMHGCLDYNNCCEKDCRLQEVDEIKINITNPEEVEVCNCGYVRCYEEGGWGGRWADEEFGRETPVEQCYKSLERVRNEDIGLTFEGLCNNNHLAMVNITREVNISKKDLTKKLLEQNCECLDAWQVGGCERVGIDGKDYPIDCKTGKSICSQYKCEEYQVEVLR